MRFFCLFLFILIIKVVIGSVSSSIDTTSTSLPSFEIPKVLRTIAKLLQEREMLNCTADYIMQNSREIPPFSSIDY